MWSRLRTRPACARIKSPQGRTGERFAAKPGGALTWPWPAAIGAAWTPSPARWRARAARGSGRGVSRGASREPAPSAEPGQSAPPLDMRGLLLTAVLVMMGFTAVAVLLGWLFQEPLLATGQWFVERFGGVGIAVGFFFPDAFTMPVPNDAFTAFGLWGGMPFWRVVAWGSLGSLLGGSTGWAIGRYLLARSPGLRAYIKRRGGDEMTRPPAPRRPVVPGDRGGVPRALLGHLLGSRRDQDALPGISGDLAPACAPSRRVLVADPAGLRQREWVGGRVRR